MKPVGEQHAQRQKLRETEGGRYVRESTCQRYTVHLCLHAQKLDEQGLGADVFELMASLAMEVRHKQAQVLRSAMMCSKRACKHVTHVTPAS